MERVKVQRTDTLRKTVRYCVEETELKALYIQRLGALIVIDEDDYKLKAVYPLLGNEVFVGPDRRPFSDGVNDWRSGGKWMAGVQDWDKVTKHVALLDGVDNFSKGMVGAYIEVDDDDVVMEIHLPPKRVAYTISWMPGFMPKKVEDRVVTTYFGADFGSFTPFRDMIQKFSDMAKEGSDE